MHFNCLHRDDGKKQLVCSRELGFVLYPTNSDNSWGKGPLPHLLRLYLKLIYYVYIIIEIKVVCKSSILSKTNNEIEFLVKKMTSVPQHTSCLYHLAVCILTINQYAQMKLFLPTLVSMVRWQTNKLRLQTQIQLQPQLTH